MAATEYDVQSVPTQITSGRPNLSIISCAVILLISVCQELGNFSSQSTVKHSCPLALNAFDIHSVPLKNSNTLITAHHLLQ